MNIIDPNVTADSYLFNTTTQTEDENFFGEQLTTFEWYFYVLNGLIGTILNLAVLVIGLVHTDTHDKPSQVYMLTRPYLNRFPFFMCYPYYVTIFTSQLCSCLNLLCRLRVLAVSVLSWISLLLMALIVYTFMTVRHACNAVEINPLIYLSICLIYVFMITTSFGISAVIYCIAHNSRRMEPQARSRLFQRLFFVFSSTLWTFVTCLPYRLLYLTNALCAPCHEAADFSAIFYGLTNFFFSILVLGIVINPLITIVTQRLYRQCVIAYVQRFFGIIQTTFGWFNGCFGFTVAQQQSQQFTTSSILMDNDTENGSIKRSSTEPKKKPKHLIQLRRSSNSRSDLHEISKLTQASTVSSPEVRSP